MAQVGLFFTMSAEDPGIGDRLYFMSAMLEVREKK
jgi:hypothetical protein